MKLLSIGQAYQYFSCLFGSIVHDDLEHGEKDKQNIFTNKPKGRIVIHTDTQSEHRNSSTLSPASRTASITQSAPISFIVPAPHKIEIVFAFAADRHRGTHNTHTRTFPHTTQRVTRTHTGSIDIYRSVSTMELSGQLFICYVIHSIQFSPPVFPHYTHLNGSRQLGR